MQPPPGPPPFDRPPSPLSPDRFVPPPAGSYHAAPPLVLQTPGEAIGALVCGVMAMSCFPLGFIAIWLGVKARRMVRENPQVYGGDTLALVGIVCGALFGIGMLLFWLVYLGIFAALLGIGFAGAP